MKLSEVSELEEIVRGAQSDLAKIAEAKGIAIHLLDDGGYHLDDNLPNLEDVGKIADLLSFLRTGAQKSLDDATAKLKAAGIEVDPLPADEGEMEEAA